VTYESQVFAQDLGVGRVEQTLAALSFASDLKYSRVDAAVAYATRRGVGLLDDWLCRSSANWQAAEKRFLISIDYGITEPRALARLASLPQSEVRVPSGLQVIARRLRPLVTFHTKTLMFRGSEPARLGIAIGSANISVSALATGGEVTATQRWKGQLDAADQALLGGAKPLLDWFEEAWEAADPLASVLPAYEAMWKKPSFRRPLPEDRSPIVQTYLKPPEGVDGSLALQLAAAKAMWIKTDVLYANRGLGQSGNQLDTPRGTRIFFGFPSADVPRNTVLGHVQIQAIDHAPVPRSVRFANNSMDKVNLPVPTTSGPPSYDNTILLFERALTAQGEPIFLLRSMSASGLARRKARSAHSLDLEMHGGRPYGLLF
jgi:hypothetical protein